MAPIAAADLSGSLPILLPTMGGSVQLAMKNVVILPCEADGVIHLCGLCQDPVGMAADRTWHNGLAMMMRIKARREGRPLPAWFVFPSCHAALV